MKRWIGDLFITQRWYFAMTAGIFLLVCSFFLSFLWYPALFYLLVFTACSLCEYLLLFASSGRVTAERNVQERWHLGAEHPVIISIGNGRSFTLYVDLIDEVPLQFQQRDQQCKLSVQPGATAEHKYSLRPLQRGAYIFGDVLVYAGTWLGLLQRRLTFHVPVTVKVYPATHVLKKFQLMAISDYRQQAGIRRIRPLGHSLEFEQIKDYVVGDDTRSINWKATARKTALMVNSYSEIRSQQIYCIVDKGRSMKMPFDGMSLLDYAINATMIFQAVALQKQDKAGLITFAEKIHDLLPAARSATQLNDIREVLYRQSTSFGDSNYEALASTIHRKLNQRSLLLLFTNFETIYALERQLPYLRQLASRHLVCVVFFRNTLLKNIQEQHPDNTEGIYIKTIAARFDYEKKQMIRQLRLYGIRSIFTTPAGLSVDVVNQYLQLKSGRII
jgi:uncharacterized protein (DUF58 family)